MTHINLARGYRGGERQTELLVRALAARGIKQRVVLRQGQPLVERLADVRGVERVVIGRPFARSAARVRGSFLHAHDGKGAHFAYAARRRAGCEYVITRRVDNRPSASIRTRRMYAGARGVAVLSQAIARVLADYHPGLSLTHIPSAVGAPAADRRRAAALRAEFGGTFVVGHVGALDERQKGQRDLIAAARTLYHEDAGWRFVLVGDGRDRATLRAAAGDCRAIRFVGHVDNVGDYLAAFDAFVFPSVHEGLGSALLDAMAAGLPIVASRVDGIPELVADGDNGLLVPPRDPNVLAAALKRLRAEPALAYRLAESGRIKARAYTPAIMAARYLRWYAALGLDLHFLSANTILSQPMVSFKRSASNITLLYRLPNP